MFVFPAPAGINRMLNYRKAGSTRVPRASGDKPYLVEFGLTPAACSPRQRG
ncbi:Uncharacterised protein [Salmonella enterica subsp. enterica serovar Montevideo]|nr:Uncharacterised protein [Salmonella enterica subsp. enterica serovar Montevideo]